MESVFVPVVEFVNNTNYCRACTKYNDASNLFSLFDTNKNIVGEIFTQCTSLKVSESDGLPSNICNLCHNQLLSFNTFRLACVDADDFFRNEIKIKNEDKEEEDYDDTPSSVPDAEKDVENCPNSCKKLVLSRKRNKCKTKCSPKIPRVRKYSNEQSEEPESHDTDVKEETFAAEDQKFDIFESNTNTTMVADTNPQSLPKIDNIKSGTRINRSRKGTVITSRKFKCDLCMKEFYQKLHIEAHMRTHQGLKAYKCGECDKSYVNLRSLKEHRRLHHNDGNLPQYHCTAENCDRSYSRKESLSAHIKAIHLKQKIKYNRNFTCEICGSSFKNNHLLQSHIFIHTGISDYQCGVCEKKLSTKYQLKVHMNRHNGIKNHVCLICGLRKVTGRELRVHMNYHTRETQHECKYCQKKFLTYGNMLRHVRILHFGEKSFKCVYCDRSFGKPDTLKHHEMTHTGEKPHGCEICGKRFIQYTALQTHRKTHRK